MPTRNTIRFVYDGAIREIRDVDPTTTVLQYLREHVRRTGTKEGCAEGDCGACTVAVGELDGSEIRYRTVNSCIQFLPTLDGKALLTVEDLKGADGELHPVQHAIVHSHGSQCGFCTPGFVMSLYVLNRETPDASAAEVGDALAGNLCRCTGYGTILEAVSSVATSSGTDGVAEKERRTTELLASLANDHMLAVDHQGSRYFAPKSIEQLATAFEQHPDATILAGGSDVGLWVTKQHRRLDTIIHLGDVADLNKIEVRGSTIEIGAAVTYSDAYATFAALHPDLGELMRRLGSRQIRNLGTVVGNIANGSPIGDSPPPLIALGASLTLRKGSSTRELPLEDYFIEYGRQDREPGEFVQAVRFQAPKDERFFRVYKISKRFDQDISAVCGAFKIEVEGKTVKHARICFGGMAGTPLRAYDCEQFLLGKPWTEETISDAQDVLDGCYAPMSDMRASSGYRAAVARNLLMKFYLETEIPTSQTRSLDAVAAMSHE